MNLVNLVAAADFPNETEVRTAAIVTGVKEIITKKGDKMAFLEIEDLVGNGELTVFPRAWPEVKELIARDEPLLLVTKVSDRDAGTAPREEGTPKRAKLIAEEVRILADALAENTLPVSFDLPPSVVEGDGGLDSLKDVLAHHPGRTEVHVWLKTDGFACKLALGPAYKVTPSREFWKEVETLC